MAAVASLPKDWLSWFQTYCKGRRKTRGLELFAIPLAWLRGSTSSGGLGSLAGRLLVVAGQSAWLLQHVTSGRRSVLGASIRARYGGCCKSVGQVPAVRQSAKCQLYVSRPRAAVCRGAGRVSCRGFVAGCGSWECFPLPARRFPTLSVRLSSRWLALGQGLPCSWLDGGFAGSWVFCVADVGLSYLSRCGAMIHSQRRALKPIFYTLGKMTARKEHLYVSNY